MQHSSVISSFITFPNITWWAYIIDATPLIFDAHEHFQKMSYRNRYCISGSNGAIQLSVPLVHGRNQRTPITGVQICNKERWQVQHWRTLVSVYKRSPFFDFYEFPLQQLFEKQYTSLIQFNSDAFHWVAKQLRLQVVAQQTTGFHSELTDSMDLRKLRPGTEKAINSGFPQYYQLFHDRTGFIPNLSILDLLFAEGPHALQWITERKKEIISWHSVHARR